MLLTLSGYVDIIRGSHTILVPHPGGIGGIFKGPNSETIVKGPDGSIITAEDEGGAVKTGIQPILVPEEKVITPIETTYEEAAIPAVAPFIVEKPVAVPIATALPVVEPLPVTYQNVKIGTKEPHIVKTEFVAAPLVEPKESTDLVGPSGSISKKGSSSIISGPASTTISGINIY